MTCLVVSLLAVFAIGVVPAARLGARAFIALWPNASRSPRSLTVCSLAGPLLLAATPVISVESFGGLYPYPLMIVGGIALWWTLLLFVTARQVAASGAAWALRAWLVCCAALAIYSFVFGFFVGVSIGTH